MDSHGPAATIFLLCFLIAFLPFCMLLASLLGGWRSLAKRYRTDRPKPAGSFLVSGRMRAIQYRYFLRLAGEPDGLSMRCLVPIAHPPLFLPWADVEIVPAKKGLLVTLQTLKLGPGKVSLRLFESDVARLLLSRSSADMLGQTPIPRSAPPPPPLA